MNDLTPNSDSPACAAAEAALQSYLDGDAIDLAAQTQIHCAVCPNCRGNVRAAIHLRRTLQLARPVSVSPGFANRLVASVAGDAISPGRKPFRTRRVWVWAALAASLLLSAGLLTTHYWPATHMPSRLPAPDFAEVRAVEPPGLRDQFAEAGSAMVSLTRRTADQAVEPTRMFFPDRLDPMSLDVVGQL